MDCNALGTNNIMKKDEKHLIQYYKYWKKTKTRQKAMKNTRLADLTNALLHSPMVTFEGTQTTVFNHYETMIMITTGYKIVMTLMKQLPQATT